MNQILRDVISASLFYRISLEISSYLTVGYTRKLLRAKESYLGACTDETGLNYNEHFKTTNFWLDC